MTALPRITREWLAGQADVFASLWPVLEARLTGPGAAVEPGATAAEKPGRAKLTGSKPGSAKQPPAIPEGWRWIWHAGRFLAGLESLGLAGWFQKTLQDDPSGQEVEAAYIALNRLGLLSHARILAQGSGLAMGWAGPAAEKLWRGIIGDAGLQAPSRSRRGPPTAQQLQQLDTLVAQFHSLEQDWRKHIGRFAKTNPRQFAEG